MDRREFLATGTVLAASAFGISGCCGDGFAQQASSSAGQSDNGSFHFPEESEPHLRTFMQWPSNKAVYPAKGDLAAMQDVIATIARAIAQFEPVVMLGAAKHAKQIKAWTEGKAAHWDIPTDDLWCRDAGPLFVQSGDGKPAIMNFNFNGWGNKQPHKNDAGIAAKIAARMGLPIYNSGVVGEPGGLEFDGQSTIIALESCWVNNNRNRMSRDIIARRMSDAVGAKKVIWAPGLKGLDITDYHIDALARFVSPGVILIQLPEKITDSDPYSKAAWDTYNILKNARDAEGRKFELVVIDEPVNIRSRQADFVASYVNYYVCNGGVVGAQFGDDKADEAARKILAELYPARQIVMLNVDPLGEAGGGVHCATQQQPLFDKPAA